MGIGIIPVPRHTRGFLPGPGFTKRTSEVKAPAGTKEKKLAAEIANGRLAPWRVGAGGHGYKGGPRTWKMPPKIVLQTSRRL